MSEEKNENLNPSDGTEKDQEVNPIEDSKKPEESITEEEPVETKETATPKAVEEPVEEKESTDPVKEEKPIETEEAEAPKAEKEPVVEEVETPKAEKESVVEEVETPKAEEKPVVEEAETPKAEEEPVVEEVETPKAEEEPVVEEVETPKAEEKPVVEEVETPEAEEKPVVEEEVEADKVEEKPVIEEPVAPVAVEEPVAPVKEEKKDDEPFVVKFDEPGEFDWAGIGKKQEQYSTDERDRLENIYENTLKSINEQQVIDGFVVSKNSREVVVNIGYKSDGVIPVTELRYRDVINIGDQIEVYVENQEDASGQLVLSHKKARILRSWERINVAMEKDEIINGFIKCRTKGGLIVDVFGIEAFLPGSQIDVKPIRDYDMYVGKTMEFKVVKINHEYKNVVVSHKALIQDELEKQKAEIIAKLEKGQILEGTVKNITSYGVFIDLGGVDGLIHITDLSWGRINHPEEIVTLDEKIKVVILDFDENKKRIALGLKQLTAHPWDSLSEGLKVGDNVKGKVVVIADYGAFVEIAPGVEGLIHVSEMSWSQHLRTAQDFLKVTDEVEAVILTLDREERKMSLGIKQLIPDPWENIMDKYPLKSKHSAAVRNFTNFGIFVELEEGVDGLIHISDLSWSKKIKHPAEFTKIGENIDVLVLEVDVDNRRLSLGHKQLEENPWDVFETVFTVDSIHSGTVVSTMDKGGIVSLPYGVEGFAPLRHLQKEDGNMAKVDDALDFKVIEFSKENKKIIVSHSKTFQDQQAAQKHQEVTETRKKEKAAQRKVKKLKDSMEKTTLGDLSVLADLKVEMHEEEVADAKAKLEAREIKEHTKTDKVEKKEKVSDKEIATEPVGEEKEEVKKTTAKKATAKKKTAAKKEEVVEEKEKKAEKKVTKAKKEEKKEEKAEKKTVKVKKEEEKEEKAEKKTAKAKKETVKDAKPVKKAAKVKKEEEVEEKEEKKTAKKKTVKKKSAADDKKEEK